MIVRPVNISLNTWADSVVLDLGLIERLDSDDWKQWGARIGQVLPQTPNPHTYDTWDKWAERMCEVFA